MKKFLVDSLVRVDDINSVHYGKWLYVIFDGCLDDVELRNPSNENDIIQINRNLVYAIYHNFTDNHVYE